jgi:L-asparagine transporter-like permease
MAYTFRGIGAMRYGQRDFRTDGSYVTTLWFVVFYVPVVPLKSIRVRRTGDTKYYGLTRRYVEEVLQQPTLDWTQIISVYAWFAALITLLLEARMRESWWLVSPILLLLGLPWLLRKRAIERVKAEAERQSMGFSASLPE